MDDYRYVVALRRRAAKAGPGAAAQAEALIRKATADILADPGDQARAEAWRLKIAEALLALPE